MRFLMLNWRDLKNPRSGGAERVTHAYLRALKERGHEVYYYANEFPGCVREEVVDGIQMIRGGGRGQSIWEAWKWYRKQPHFDLVVDQHHGIPWFAPWWSRTNCVAYIHEVLGPIWDAFYSFPWNEIGRQQERCTHWIYRNIPFWVGSESTRVALLKQGIKQVQVIPYGIDTEPLAQLDDKRLTLPVRLVTVSRLAPNKRVSHAIDAAALLVQRGVAAHLTIVGTGEIEPEIRRLAQNSPIAGRITFTGALPEAEKNDTLRNSHLLLHTSLREGWGLNVIEANAMGTPAVVYPVPGLVDSTIAGQTGVVTASETPEAVADSVQALVANPAEYARLRQNAWERAQTFLWRRVLPQACDWLEQQAIGKPPKLRP